MGKQPEIIGELIRKTHRSCPSLWIWNDFESRLNFATDRSGIYSLPDAIVLPANEDELSCFFEIAREYPSIPITPQGARTGTTGGGVPIQGGIVLSTLRMNRIWLIDKNNRLVIVEPGVITGALHRILEKQGIFYPPDPASLDICTIGGNIAEDAGGPRAVKYGVTHDALLGITVYLSNGVRLELGGKTHKDVAGYRLASLFTGSEGTLGIITRAILRVIPLPETRCLILCLFPEVSAALSCVHDALERETPSAIEFLDYQATRLIREHLPLCDAEKAKSLLFIELDGSKRAVESQLDNVRQICHKNAAIDLIVAHSRVKANKLWGIRRHLSPALYNIAPTKLNHDIVVPLTSITSLVERLSGLSDEYGLPIATFGHVGDGNLHVNIMTDKNNPVAYQKALKAVDRLFREVIALEGSISGEHGIGLTKKAFLPDQLSSPVLTTMKNIKKLFDPEGRLNPGKIFE